ncbi:hypothetical protein K6U51_12735 [Vibrio fluvialis]|uniref:hypothetical protein n=1 Tax=Vibrio fluvialis TaxID=676 RepID=UPI001EECECD4|nr:hypothetical protein [Vibrio fluvialis]MCG6387505.1 hypothetical protein [Vibrio fluvialis]MCG6418898.1 hypothetical protein [Vibrio fluvialis]
MINDNDVERFKSFYAAGGLVEASNLTKGKALVAATAPTSELYSATIEPEADYSADGVQRLPDAILTLSSELNAATAALTGWNEYLVIATDPFDLQQVAQGAEVYRKVKPEPNDSLWPSIVPITSKPEIEALESAVNSLKSYLAETQALMAEVNASVWPDPVESPGPDGEPVSTRTPIPLTPEQVDKCLVLAGKLEAEVGGVSSAAAVIGNMASTATSKRTLALAYFSKAVSFIVCSNQVKLPSVGDATKEVFNHY